MANNETWIVVTGGRVKRSEVSEILTFPNATNAGDNVSKSFFKLKDSETLICINDNDCEYFHTKFGITVTVISNQIP